jgi:hypothetical protein
MKEIASDLDRIVSFLSSRSLHEMKTLWRGVRGLFQLPYRTTCTFHTKLILKAIMSLVGIVNF